MTKDLKKQHQWCKISLQMQRRLQTAAIVCYMVVMFVQPAAVASTTDTIWTRFSTIMSDIYGELLGISTIVAVTAAAVALLVRMISRNERAVAEATSWLKRIVVTWIVLNTLGFIVAYLQPLTRAVSTPPRHVRPQPYKKRGGNVSEVKIFVRHRIAAASDHTDAAYQCGQCGCSRPEGHAPGRYYH